MRIKRMAFWSIMTGFLLLAASLLAGCDMGSPTLPPFATPRATATVTPSAEMIEHSGESDSVSAGIPGEAAKAVDLIGAWVEAGAPKTAPFSYEGYDGGTYQATFEADVLPLFTQNGVWFEGSQACAGCHFGNTENSYHEMNLTSYEGILTGADSLSAPPGVSILGASAGGATDFDWNHSRLRARLRNNRMPPGWVFDVTETNRDGLCLEISPEGAKPVQYQYDNCDFHAADLIGAWVEAGAPETDSFEFGGAQLNFARDVQPFFTQPNMWFEGSQACTGCHFGNTENSYHEMDLSTYQGILAGADSLSAPPGVSILGASAGGATDFNWNASKLKERLRNNRMPPGVAFDITEENRDGPMILAGKKK